MTRNYAWSGDWENNPTGLIYKLHYSYDIVTTETAWGGACDSENYWDEIENPDGFVYFFNPPPGQGDGGNWASFFVYQVK